PGREERAAEVRAPAAPPRNHATRRPLDRAMRRIEHACTVERLVRMPGAFEVELITSRPAERMLLVRPDLRVDAERTQERERSSGNRGAREIEMQRDLPAAAQVHAARGVEQTGQLRESIAVRFGRDLGELVA